MFYFPHRESGNYMALLFLLKIYLVIFQWVLYIKE